MELNAKVVLIIIGIAAIVLALMLVTYKHYAYLMSIGIFLLFLMMIYLAWEIKS